MTDFRDYAYLPDKIPEIIAEPDPIERLKILSAAFVGSLHTG